MRGLFFLSAALVFLCAAALSVSGCASAPEAVPAGDAVYAYDFERVMLGVEQAARARMSGYEYSQTVKKTSVGYAVAVHGGAFVVPELSVTLSVSDRGEVSSPDNATVHGLLKKDGSLSWQGLLTENGQLVQVIEQARLLKSASADRAPVAYDGVYMLQNDAGGVLLLTVEDGLSLAEVQGEELPFTPQPVIVSKDGSFASRFVLTTEQLMPGYGKTTFSTEYTAEGRLLPGGKAELRTLTSTGGNIVPQNSTPFVYAGDRSSQSLVSGAGAVSGRLASAATAQNAPKRAPAPEWYSEDTVHADGAVLSCGQRTDDDETVAVSLAEAEAAGKLSALIALQLSERTEAQESLAEAAGQGSTGRELRTVIDAVSALRLGYTVVRSVYDAKSGTAFVQVSLSDGELADARASLGAGGAR